MLVTGYTIKNQKRNLKMIENEYSDNLVGEEVLYDQSVLQREA